MDSLNAPGQVHCFLQDDSELHAKWLDRRTGAELNQVNLDHEHWQALLGNQPDHAPSRAEAPLTEAGAALSKSGGWGGHAGRWAKDVGAWWLGAGVVALSGGTGGPLGGSLRTF